MSLPRDALLQAAILILFYRNSSPTEWTDDTRFPNAVIYRDDRGALIVIVVPAFLSKLPFAFANFQQSGDEP